MQDGQDHYQNVSFTWFYIRTYVIYCTLLDSFLQSILMCFTGVQACSYPGTTISGSMSSVKFYYKIGENITFTCDEGLTLHGAAMLKCLRNGKWSNAIPTCITDSDEEKQL